MSEKELLSKGKHLLIYFLSLNLKELNEKEDELFIEAKKFGLEKEIQRKFKKGGMN